MNLCNVNFIQRDITQSKVNEQHDQLQQTLSNARICLFLLNFCDQNLGFRIEASCFFRAFSGKKVVTISQEECFGLEGIRISPIIDWSPSLRFSLPLKEVPLLAILTRNISSNFFPWGLVNMWVQFLKKAACYRPLKNRHFVRVCTEKTMDHQYRKNGARNIYSSYNQMRAYVDCSPSQSKKLYLIDFSIEQSTKLWGFRDSAGRFCIKILPGYCSSALTAHAYKMVITTVQIDTCFCNKWIVLHLCASLRWFRGTLLLAIYGVFSLTWTQFGNSIIELPWTLNLICKGKQLIWLSRTVVQT